MEKAKCPECNGSGSRIAYPLDECDNEDTSQEVVQCPKCKGTGQLPIDPPAVSFEQIVELAKEKLGER